MNFYDKTTTTKKMKGKILNKKSHIINILLLEFILNNLNLKPSQNNKTMK